MKDEKSRRDIIVSTDGDAGPYIIVPVSQIPSLEKLLSVNKVSYWIDDDAISLDGGPQLIVFNLARMTDPGQIQAMLDANR